MIARLSSSDAGFDASLTRLLDRQGEPDAQIEAVVRAIIADVRARGDAALLEYTARFDSLAATSVAGSC